MALKTLLSAVTTTGASLPVGTDSNKAAFVQISGITSATVLVQGSVDGSTWSTIGSSVTADGLVTISDPPPYIRANVSVYISGTITVKASV
jgi:hypothetical protein